MPIPGPITRDSLMTLEAYSRHRPTHLAAVRAHRRQRSVALGDHITLQFESETTVRHQIQEMLRIEKLFEDEDIAREIAAYAPLLPDGHNWKATMMIAYPDVHARKQALARLVGVEDRVYVVVAGHAPVHAIADEDLDRSYGEKTAAVHFLRFELAPPLVAALKAGAGARLGCDHPHYPAEVAMAPDTLASLVGDLR